jgi:hypothetical protein
MIAPTLAVERCRLCSEVVPLSMGREILKRERAV